MNAKQKMNWRRWTALLLCLLLTLSALPLQALAAETQTDVVTCTDPTNADVAITYDYDTRTLTVSGSGRFSGQVLGADGSTAVNMLDAFSVSQLVVEEGITAIGPEGATVYSIADSETNTIYLPDSLTAENFSCKGASNLCEIRLPAGMHTLRDGMFDGCTWLETLNMPQGVTEIGKRTFGGCKSLDVELPPQLERIGDKAFYRSGIKNAILPDTVRSIGSGAFEQTRSMVSATLPTTITAVPERMFYASYVERVSLPVGLQSIGKAAFFNCMHLTDLQLPEGLITIEGSAFSGCTVLKELTLPGSLKHVGEKVFGGSNIEIVHVEEGITELAPVMFADCPLTQVDLPNTLTTIQDAAFYNCTKLKEITLPNSVTKLGEGVFQGCSSLSQVRLSENLKTLPASTFDGCKALTEFDFAGITEIGSEAFQNTGIQILDLPTTVKMLGESAFAHSALQEIWSLGGVETLPTDVFAYAQIQSFDIPQGLYIAPGAFEYSALQKVATGIDVTEINDGAFRNCRKLTSVELNEDVTRIGDNAFRACTALTSIDFPESLVSIGDYAFYTSGLTSLVVPNTVQQMGRMAFAGSALTEVSVVSGVKTLGDYAFAGCHATFRLPMSLTEMGKYPLGFTASESDGNVTVFKMEDVNVIAPAASESIRYAKENDLKYKMIGPEDTDFNEENYLYGTVGDGDWYFDKRTGALSTNATNVGTKQGFYFTNGQLWNYKQAGVRSVHLLNGVKNLGDIFAGITTLEQVTATDSLTNINTDAFVGCTGLKSVSLPAVTKIGANSFADCTALQTVDLPLAATISDHAFQNCTALQFLELPAVTKITSTAFAGCTGLTDLTLGKGAAVIDDRAFTDCKALTNLDLGSTVSIGREAFAAEFIGNGNLEQVTVSSENPYLYADGSGLYSKDKSTLYAAVTGKGDYTENTASAIGDWALSCNAKLKKVTLGKSVRTVGTKAFAYDQKLKYVQLTDGLQQIGASAFTGCTALKVLELPDTVTTLGNNVFENCTALASVLLSGGLTALPTYAFRNCTALTGVVVPDSVAAFNPGAFADCKALKEVYIGSQSTRYVQLGTNRTHVFARCPALTVYTMAGSDAAVYAKTRNIPTELYTDADAFADLCAMKRDIYAGYLGFCTDGHGDIQWLTVYAADCTHDGYAIGVCEYCSAILEERHTTATGHNYVVSETPAADGRDGVRITTCQNCGDSSYTVLPGSGTAMEETHTVTGTVVLAADRAATKGTHAAIGADILLNGYTLATTDEKGNFSLQLKSGTYALTVRYAYGFSRTLYVVVSDRDLQCGSVPVIGCDWNKDGKIDDQDYYMFKLIFGTHQGQAGYLSYVDMNHDGMINTRDMIFVERCMGLQAGSFAYTPLVIR